MGTLGAAVLVASAAPPLTPWGPADGVFNVKDFGAVGDGVHNDTAAIASALRAAEAHQAAGARVSQVLLPAPGSFLTAAVFLPASVSNLDIHIEGGATLLGSTWWDDFPWMLQTDPKGGSWRSSLFNANATCDVAVDVADPSGRNFGPLGPSYVRDDLSPAGKTLRCLKWRRMTNVSLTGDGTIDGQGFAWWYNPAYNNHRSEMIRPIAVDHLRIYGLTMRRAPSWTHRILLCTDVHARGIRVEAGVDYDASAYSGHNVDGFDPDSCDGVLLEDSTIRAGDDCVAVYSTAGPTRNVVVRNVTCYTPISVTHGMDTRGVLFENVTVRGDWGSPPPLAGALPRWWKTAMRVKSDRHTNITMTDVVYRNIRAVDVDLGANIELSYACQNMSASMHDYELCRQAWTREPGVTPRVSGIRYENVRIEGGWRAGWLECLPESPCHNVTVDGMAVTPLSAEGRRRAGLEPAPEGGSGVHPWFCEDVKDSSARGAVPAPTAQHCPGVQALG